MHKIDSALGKGRGIRLKHFKNKKKIKWLFFIILVAMMLSMTTIMHVSLVTKPMEHVKIALDAGHGGPDGGASSTNGQLEKQIALKVVHRLRELCEQAGAEVMLTRETDMDLGDADAPLRQRKQVDLVRRVRMLNAFGADVTLSLHLNSIPGDRWRGAQTFFDKTNDRNEQLAKNIQSELIDGLENTTRSAKIIDHVYILKRIHSPAALVEIGFLSNPDESKQLATESYQNKVAESIFRGLIRFLEQEPVSGEAAIVR